MERSSSQPTLASAVGRFGLAARVLVSSGATLDEVVRGCGATTPVDPRPAELEAVKQMSGLTEDGALRVLALRERLLELSALCRVWWQRAFFSLASLSFQEGLGCSRSTP